MGLFSRRPEVSTEEFCRGFYNQNFFEIEIPDAWRKMCEIDHNLITGHDPTFRLVDLGLFSSELQILRLEVFAIAWLHFVDTELAPIQSEFTKRYLEERGYSDIWDAMGDYNQGVARSTVGGKGRGYVAKLNLRRTEAFGKWDDMGYEGKVVARAANRLGSDRAMKSMRVHTYLSFVLTDRLGCEVTKMGRRGIMAIIKGFYDGAAQAIKEVKVVA